MEANKNLSFIVTELFSGGRKSCFKVPKATRIRRDTLFHHENTKQKSISTNTVNSFI